MGNNDRADTSESMFLFNRTGQRSRRRSEREASLWIWSPGNLELLTHGERLICSLGIAQGPPLQQAEFLRAVWQKGTQVIYLFPTSDADPDAVAVSRSGTRVTCNLSDSLIEWGLALAVNTKSRFRMTVTQPEGLPHPVVKVDLSQPVETKSTAKKKTGTKSSHSNPSDQTAAGSDPEGETEA